MQHLVIITITKTPIKVQYSMLQNQVTVPTSSCTVDLNQYKFFEERKFKIREPGYRSGQNRRSGSNLELFVTKMRIGFFTAL
jgi:hypothetical protein